MKRSGFLALLLASLLFCNGGLRADQVQLSFTYTVTKTEDSDDGVCERRLLLREAIKASNANLLGQDTIAFDIPENDPQCDPNTHVCMIQPTSPLPEITDPVILDGTTQPGARPNTLAEGDDAILLIELDGFLADSDLLRISASGSVVRGLVFHDFKSRNAITLDSSSQSRIEGNFIGTDATGTAQAEGGCEGIDIIGGSQNIVGGDLPQARNIISVKSNCEGSSTGVVISNGSFENRVEEILSAQTKMERPPCRTGKVFLSARLPSVTSSGASLPEPEISYREISVREFLFLVSIQ
jgi:hypothetical protein